MGMQEQRYEELETRAAAELEADERTLAAKLQASKVIHNELESMRQEDKILLLSEEEERMIRAFRGFKVRTKPGGVFQWQTRPDAAVVAGQLSLIQDPQDVSSGG